MNNPSRGLRAFTLIELLIVVAIIAILAAIAVPNFLEAQTRSKVSRAKADLRTLHTALEAYLVDNNKYPYTESINVSVWLPPGGFPRSSPTSRCGGLTSPIAYITTIPQDAFQHEIVDLSGIPQGRVAPIYWERAGFGFTDGVKQTNKNSFVPSDAVGTGKLDGTGADTAIGDPSQTPRDWIMYSLGPDLSPHLKNPAGGFFTRSRWNLNNRYDPTNGTVSGGNVIRLADGTNFP